MKGLLVFFIALGVSFGAHADGGALRIAVFGDSLVSGRQLQPEESFPAKLEKKLKDMGYQNVEAINMSIDGETTAGGVARLQPLLAAKPDVAVVVLGANDARRGIDPAVINNNLGAIIGALQSAKAYVILVGIKAPPNAEQGYYRQVEAIYPSLASFYKVAFYPFALEGVYEKPELSLADGFHPNAQGVDVMVEGMYRLVDAGLRWAWEKRRQEEEYRQQYQQYQQQLSGK